MKLKKSYLGDSTNYIIQSLNQVKEISEEFVGADGKIIKNSIEFHCTKEGGNDVIYKFGNLAIMESMAFFCEQMIFPNVLQDPPELPYKAAPLLIKHIYPKLLDDPLNILALCDVSLSMFDAGIYLYEMVLLMKKLNWVPTQPEDIYKFCTKNTTFDYRGAKNSVDFLKKIGYEAIEQLNACFEAPHYSENKHWIKYTLETAINLRVNRNSFILELVKGGELKNNAPFLDFFSTFGMPLVTNRQDVLLFSSPVQKAHNLKPDAIWVINQIFNIYCNSNPAKRCELKLYCKESCAQMKIEDFTDENCYSSPWDKAIQDSLCPFGAQWKTWGLTGFSPQAEI